MSGQKTATLMGLPFTCTDLAGATRLVGEASPPLALAVANTHVVALAWENSEFRKTILGHDVILAESAPVAVAIRKIRGDQTKRVYGPDLMDAALRGYPNKKHFLLGRNEATLRRLGIKYGIPEYRQLACEDPVAETPAILDRIRETGAEIVWVGLGTPHQQRWCVENRTRADALLLGVGFAFAANAELQARPPEWALRHGMAWIWRLAKEPVRLGPRYLKYNTIFLLLALKAWLRSTHHN